MPLLHLLAGSKGAGKPICVRDVLTPTMHLPFISADATAASLWPEARSEHAYEAAQVAETRRRDKFAMRESFISETVFSHPSKVQPVCDAADAGYLRCLHVMMVPVELSVQRVLLRRSSPTAAHGTHFVCARLTSTAHSWEHRAGRRGRPTYCEWRDQIAAPQNRCVDT